MYSVGQRILNAYAIIKYSLSDSENSVSAKHLVK